MRSRAREKSPVASRRLFAISLLPFLVPLLLWGCAADGDADNLAFYVAEINEPGMGAGVYAYDVFEGTSRLLVAGRVSDVKLSPDGRRLVLRHITDDFPSVTRTRVISVSDGHDVVAPQALSPFAWLGNDHFLDVVDAGGSLSLVRVNLDGSARRVIFESKESLSLGWLSVSPDERTLVWVDMVGRYDAGTLCSLDVASGVLSRTPPMGEAANVLGSRPIFLPDGNIGWTNLESTALFVSDPQFKQIKRRAIAEEADVVGDPRLQIYADDRLVISRNARSNFNVLAPGAGLMQPLLALNDIARMFLFPATVQLRISRARTFVYFSGDGGSPTPRPTKSIFTRPDGSVPRVGPLGAAFFVVD